MSPRFACLLAVAPVAACGDFATVGVFGRSFGEHCGPGEVCIGGLECVSERCVGDLSAPIVVTWWRGDPPPDDLLVTVYYPYPEDDPATPEGLFDPGTARLTASLTAPVIYPARLSIDGFAPGTFQLYALVNYVDDRAWLGFSHVITVSDDGALRDDGEVVDEIHVFFPSNEVRLVQN